MEVGKHIQQAEITAVIIRADGTVEELGVIDAYDKTDTKPEQRKDATSWRQS